ncbi:MAG TPA: S8 family serine peptidase, partial [Eudoraea sp.]|nr:S8 family serine peptidase [Eudoraea sp.]
KIGDAFLQGRARVELEAEYSKAQQNKQQYEQILQAVKNADDAVKKHLGKETYTKKEIAAIKTEDAALQQHIGILKQMFTIKDSMQEIFTELNEAIKHFSEQLEYHLNVNFNGREVVGDDPYDFNDRNYGNGNPMNRSVDESHGTHAAGIIAAERNNGIGIDGVANNVEIMSVRMLPNGDEYDKDVALGIRYAVDNGAKIINMSLGKGYSPNAEWVYDALRYAAANDVLIVHASGNDGENIDDPKNPGFPNDHGNHEGGEIVDNVIEVGALEPKYGSEMVAEYSNYGKKNVDVFAPGSDIYSTMPHNKYEFQGGTSMAAPAVAGVAALIRSQYPNLTASEVKKIIMVSGLKVKTTVILGGDPSKATTFDEICKSGKIVNAYNALILADKVNRDAIKI